MNAHQWIERGRTALAHPRLPDAAGIVLVVLLGWQLAGLTWAALPTPAAARMPEPTAPEAASGPGAADDAGATARIARLHLFGEPPTDDAGERQSAGADADAPETQLNLTLKGVYAPGDGRGIAIIAAGGGPEKVYSVGDTIAGSARITGIFDDRVALRRNGRAETLRLDLAESVAPPPETNGGTRGSGDTRDAAAGVVERARELRQRIRENPMELARMVRFQPYVEDGKLVGYRIQQRSDEASLLSEVGIRPTDVVTRINGIPLNDPQQGNRALQELRDARMINVTVLRDGRSRRLSIPIGNPG